MMCQVTFDPHLIAGFLRIRTFLFHKGKIDCSDLRFFCVMVRLADPVIVCSSWIVLWQALQSCSCYYCQCIIPHSGSVPWRMELFLSGSQVSRSCYEM